MNYKIRSLICTGALFLVMAFALTSCYETHYYHHYHHHTHGWYDSHHAQPPAGIDWNVDVEAH